MGENLLESYNPLYDVHLRQYFALPHMQKHLRNLGLQQNELHAGHLTMMDLLLRNRERVLQQLMDLQRKLDAVEKVELYRRIRSGITNADESADRHQHMSRSLSRPARSAAARLGERRGRRQSLSPEAGELIKRVESDYRSDSAPFKNPKSIYNRLAASLDDRTLRKYMLSLRKQLAKLERFREVSFGPHTMAKHPPLQLQQSWFFRRRSLKSGLASKARSGKSQSPLKFASAIDEPPTKMQRRTSISRTRQQRLPPLPKKRSFAASRTNTLPTSKPSERLPPTATTKPIRNTPSDTRRALPPSSAQKKTPTGSRPGSKGSTTPVFVQKRSSASSGILPAIGGAAAPSPSISLAASQTTTTDGGQPGGDSEWEEQKTAPEGMNGGTETRPTPEPFLEQEIGKYEPEVRIESEERIEEQQTTPAPTNDGAGMEEHQTEPFQRESSSSLERRHDEQQPNPMDENMSSGQTPQEYSIGIAEVEASSPEESREEGINELETRSNHPQERIGAVEEASPEERVDEVGARLLEHPEESVEEVETRLLEHPEESVDDVETRSFEHPEERIDEVETRSLEHPEERVEEVETRSLEHSEERIDEVETRSLEHPEERVEEVETRSLEHPEERIDEVETRSLEHPEERVEEVETRSLELRRTVKKLRPDH
uniref:Uncharacterized protein n=1 Tax=Globodera pallida TaxID=36090 RepID=A0A183BJG9_GLOPA